MGEIINLRQVRKQKARTEKERLASENRVLHGRSKAEKARDRLTSERAENFVAGHHRERSEDKDKS